jgi:1-acyl-sn-glycerol-3-phosphate acyltransferase
VNEPPPGLRDDPVYRVLARRLFTVPLYLGLYLLVLLLAPLWVPLTLLVDALRSGPRTATRCGAFFMLYLQCEVVGILGSAAIWLLSGVWAGADRQRFLAWNYALQGWWTGALLHGSARIWCFEIDAEGTEAVAKSPLLLMQRHASVADTLLAAEFVSKPHGIRLRYVLKRELLWDPCLDIVGNRLPNHFVGRSGEDSAREIQAVARLAENLGPDDGVLIYPEGTRYTPAKLARVLERLARSDDPELLARAKQLRHVLPPRLGGPLALLDAAPGVDVVFCAHDGFDRAGTFWDLWNGSLLGQKIRSRFWRVPYAQVPSGRHERIEWLFEHWMRIDDWIGRQRDPRSV